MNSVMYVRSYCMRTCTSYVSTFLAGWQACTRALTTSCSCADHLGAIPIAQLPNCSAQFSEGNRNEDAWCRVRPRGGGI